VHHKRHAGIDGFLGHPDRQIDSTVLLGEGGEHRQLVRRLGVVGRLEHKGAGVVAIPGCEE